MFVHMTLAVKYDLFKIRFKITEVIGIKTLGESYSAKCLIPNILIL